MPSEVLHDIAKGRLDGVRRTPEQIEAAFKPLLADVKKAGLSPEEEVMLGLAYFFTFDGLSARPIFEKHMERSDRLGRVSWQSLQMMSYFGAKDYPLVERRISEYRKKFPPTPNDLEHTGRMLGLMVNHYASRGDHARAVALILEDLAALPLDLPFSSFNALGRNFKSFQETGKAQVAIDWMRKHRDALQRRLLAAGERAPKPNSEASVAASLALPHRPGVLHFDPFLDALFEDDPRFSLETANLIRATRAVQRLDQWIAAAEKGGPLPDLR